MAATENSIKVQFYNSKGLKISLETRSGEGVPVSQVAQRDLERYYETLRRSLPAFTEAEAELIVNALNGARHSDPASIGYLWAEVADADSEAVTDAAADLDGVAFTQMILRNLSYAECASVVDAVERFWAGPYHQEGPIGPRLREVGLVRDKESRNGVAH